MLLAFAANEDVLVVPHRTPLGAKEGTCHASSRLAPRGNPRDAYRFRSFCNESNGRVVPDSIRYTGEVMP